MLIKPKNLELATSRWFSPVSSTSKTDHYDIAEILLTVALSTINAKPKNTERMKPKYFIKFRSKENYHHIYQPDKTETNCMETYV